MCELEHNRLREGVADSFDLVVDLDLADQLVVDLDLRQVFDADHDLECIFRDAVGHEVHRYRLEPAAEKSMCERSWTFSSNAKQQLLWAGSQLRSDFAFLLNISLFDHCCTFPS